MKSSSRRIAACAALLAALLGAFAATVTHFVAFYAGAANDTPDRAAPMAISCPMHAAAGPAQTPATRDTCPFCVDPGVLHAPPPCIAAPVGLVAARYPVPLARRVPAPQATVWLGALSRGPPALS